MRDFKDVQNDLERGVAQLRVGVVKNADWRGFPRSTAQSVGTECLLNERLYIFAGEDFSLSHGG
jgi:hypothetical protein